MVSLSNGSELAINKRISANGNVELIADGKVSAGALYSVNGATVNLNGGGIISGITRDSADVAAEIRDGSTLSATNIDFTGEIGIDNGSRVTLTGGSVTSGNQYLDEGKPTPEGRKTEIAVRGEGTVFTANGVTINSNLGVFNGGKMIINDSDINAEHAIYAGEGSNTSIILNGSKDNIYTVDQILAAKDGAKIYINGGKLKANNLYALMYEAKYEGETVTSDPKSIVLDKDGYIETMSDQIYANAASEYQRESGAIINEGIDFKGGTLVLNDAQYTLSYSETALAELQKQGGTKLTLTGTMVEESGEEQKDVKLVDIINDAGSAIEHDKINALVDGNLLVGSDTVVGNVEGIKIEQSVKNGFSVASIELKEGSSSVVITNGKDITLGGSEGGSVVTVAGEDANVKIVVGTTSSVVGASEKKGSLNIGNSFAKEDTQYKLQGDVVINRDSSLNTKGQVAITGDISVTHGNINVIKGSLNVQNINVKDNVNILGNVNIEKLQSLDNSGGVRVNVGNNEKSGQLTVQEIKLNGGTVFLDPAWQDGATISDASGLAVMNVNNGIDGKYVVGRNSLLSLGCTSEKAQALFANSEQNWGPQGITVAVCIADHIDVSNGSIVVDGSLVETSSLPSINNGKVVFGDDSLVIIDGSKVKGSQAAITNITAAEISNSSKLFIANVQRDTTYDVLDFAPGSSSVFWEHDNVILGSSMMRFASWNLNSFTTYAVSLTDQYGNDINAPNSFDQAGASGGVAEDFWNHASDATRSYDAQVSAFNSAAAMGELAGVEHGTFAVSNLFTDAVAEHMSLVGTKAHDKDIWAKYIHSKNKVDGLAVAGNYAKYDATYNGIVVGSDLYKQDKGVVGVALTYVDGNIKDNTLAARTENDATYYGLNIYGGIQNEDSVVVGDISYLHGKNDITQRNSGMNLTADAKSDAFSIGVHAEKAIKAGVGKFAPYAGLRYMHLGTGNYTNSIGIAYDGDDMNLWILPVGVKYSADIQKGVWNIRPVAEIGYVWNMGDRNAKQTVSLNGASDGFGFDVADSGSYVGRLAVEAERANVTYGLGYEYQKGDSVNNNKWTANVTWSF